MDLALSESRRRAVLVSASGTLRLSMKEDTFLCALRGGELTSAVCSLQEGGDNRPSSEVPWLRAKLLQLGLADRARGVGWMPEFKDLLSSLKVCPSVCLSALPRAYNVCYGCWVYEERGCTTLATTEAVECEHRKGLYVLEQRLFEGLLTEMFVCLKRRYEKLGFRRDIEFLTWEALRALGYSTGYPLPEMDLVDSFVALKNEARVQVLAGKDRLGSSRSLAFSDQHVDAAIAREDWKWLTARGIMYGRLSEFVDLAEEDARVALLCQEDEAFGALKVAAGAGVVKRTKGKRGKRSAAAVARRQAKGHVERGFGDCALD